jgi:hypothetical protein
MWSLGAISKPGSISRSEFMEGMKKLKCSNISGLVKILPSFDPGFLEKHDFRGYKFIIY